MANPDRPSSIIKVESGSDRRFKPLTPPNIIPAKNSTDDTRIIVRKDHIWKGRPTLSKTRLESGPLRSEE